ncbi:MAG: type IV pilin protein [Leptospirillia bacterium]
MSTHPNGDEERLRLSGEEGFTLIELMIVVAIIGVLASIAIPRFQNNAMTSRQAEARVILRAVHTSQQLYLADNNTYGASEAVIGMDTTGTRVYAVAFSNVTATTFTATATANLDDDATIDRWIITDSTPIPTQTCDDITNAGASC